MKDKEYTMKDLGELRLIQEIENLIFQKTKKKMIRDDSFYYELKYEFFPESSSESTLILNSDMLVSTTDVPSRMSYFQIGRKAVIMNISDLIVKGVAPKGIVISLGLPNDLKLKDFRQIILGIIEVSKFYNIDYIGGDLNETRELIINPTVFGFQQKSKIIHRKPIQEGDLLVSNGKFGLTAVGFDILFLERSEKKNTYRTEPRYKKSISSVIEPSNIGKEGLILAEEKLATASIDSSDGLGKSLGELMDLNPKIGFELNFNHSLIHEEAINYAQEVGVRLQDLIFKGGEEFIHLFVIDPNNYKRAKKEIEREKGKLFEIGRVIPMNKIILLREGEKMEIKPRGFEHFSQS